MKPPKIKTLLYQAVLSCFFLALTASVGWAAGAMLNYDQLVSANIPLDSPAYLYLDKLEGLGYLDELRPDTKPYTRRQVARWVRVINENVAGQDIPGYAQRMLEALRTEFAVELARFKTIRDSLNGRLSGLAWSNTYYDGAALPQAHTKSSCQPLNVNQNGYRLREGLNSALTVRIESEWEDFLVLSATPRLSYDEVADGSVSFESGYFKTGLGNLELQLGKDALWWGPGQRGSLPLSNNATPQTMLKLSNLEPVEFDGVLRFLRQMDATFFCSQPDEHREVAKASLVGLRTTFNPFANFTFGGSLNAIVGGEGHEWRGRDYWKFFTGENATTKAEDKWDSLAGFDFRLRVPRLNGLQLYGELYGEDQCKVLQIIPFPYQNAYLAGLTIPKLSADGRWDLTIETARTTKVWYQHYVYDDGYTYRNNLIGDAMGNDAERYYVKLARYCDSGRPLAWHAERLTMDRESAAPRRVDSVWVSFSTDLSGDLSLTATLGAAWVESNVSGAPRRTRNYLGSVTVRKYF